MSAPSALTDLRLALTVVLHSSRLAARVQRSILSPSSSSTQTKSDTSPVTLADYASQSLVSSLLAHYRPSDALIAEEASADLAKDEQLTQKVVDAAQEALSAAQAPPNPYPHSSGAEEGDAGLSPPGLVGENEIWGVLERRPSREKWLEWLDRGSTHEETREGRVWTLDPIDGTKGFLRGGQYAVCLALLEDGRPTLGVIGCPNMLVDPVTNAIPTPTDPVPESHASASADSAQARRGVLFYATQSEGAFQLAFPTPSDPSPVPIPISVPIPKPSSAGGKPLSSASTLESVEAAHSAHSTQGRIAKELGIEREPVRMDSQAKYGALARGEGGVYLRLPVRGKGYVEKIWDHAAGVILVKEAGGAVTDSAGKELDFSQGRRLEKNVGVVASHTSVQELVIEAVQKALKEEE